MIIIFTGGLIIGSLVTDYLKNKGLEFNYKFILIAFILFYIVYCIVGIMTNEYKKPNGNICRGYEYGFKICSGDINVE